jgi:pilus assembly protein Flp/PilA
MKMLAVLRRSSGRAPARRSEEGASAVEYGLLVAAIAAVIVALVFALGAYVRGAFQTTCDNIANTGVKAVGTSTQCGTTNGH